VLIRIGIKATAGWWGKNTLMKYCGVGSPRFMWARSETTMGMGHKN